MCKDVILITIEDCNKVRREFMVTLKGKGVFGGVAIGKISFYQRAESTIKRYHVDDIDAELKRVEDEGSVRQSGCGSGRGKCSDF